MYNIQHTQALIILVDGCLALLPIRSLLLTLAFKLFDPTTQPRENHAVSPGGSVEEEMRQGRRGGLHDGVLRRVRDPHQQGTDRDLPRGATLDV